MMDIIPPSQAPKPTPRPVFTQHEPRRSFSTGAYALPGGAALLSLAVLLGSIWFLHWTQATPLLASLQLAGRCGDGTVQLGEECDDGNLDFGDGCSSQCQVQQIPKHIERTEPVSGPFASFVNDVLGE